MPEHRRGLAAATGGQAGGRGQDAALELAIDWQLPAGYRFEPYEEWFRQFTAAFLRGSAFDLGNVQLKIDHSLRVLELTQCLTTALATPPELGALAHVAALCHDVGRFPQYARFQTFHDQQSLNHALQGVLTLKEQRVLAGLPAAAQKRILAAVACHNRRQLPPHFEPTARYLTNLVRDADKLDIFAVMLTHFAPGAPPNKVVNLGLKVHPDNYTPAILAAVERRQLINYQDMVWVNDFKLLLCSWLYDLNFPFSRKIVQERGYLEQLFASLPQRPEFVHLRQQLAEELAGATPGP
ncbi:MAG: HD domain-containing protein [Desulfobacca sp.]|uniref:HD domain-containing protein n=1 Tax=Desulfobacca sp. TaxID=2067990 RepID=UPI00404AEC71